MGKSSSTASSALRRALPLRMALLIDEPITSQYVFEFTQWAQSHPDIVITHLIVQAPPRGELRGSLLRRLAGIAYRQGHFSDLTNLAFALLVKFERILISRNKHHSAHFRPCDLSALVKESVEIAPIVSKSGHVYRFGEADIRKVNELRADLLVYCGSRVLRGEILSASRLGVISIFYGDDRINRGGPAGFWEVFFQQETTGFTIRRLTEGPDTGDVLMRGHVATRHYYALNQAFLFRKANHHLKRVVEKIAATDRLPDFLSNFPYSHRPYRAPMLHEVGVYFLRLCCTLLAKKVKYFLGIHHRWNVAYIPGDWKNAELWRATKLVNEPYHCLADPFVIHRDSRAYCFVEDLDYRRDRGSIAVYELTDTGGIRIGTALEEDFHLSFPYLFEFQGDLYMCPETSENGDIRIYKCIEFPLRWKFEKVLMEKVSAADSMIFERAGKWWMLTNIDPAGIRDHCTELLIFSANSPVDTDWQPHPLNPILVDASRARNAGRVGHGEGCFRFSQGQGFDFYGRRVLINRIRELTETSYAEECVAMITPSFRNGVVGTHHLHSDGRMTVFDFAISSRVSIGDRTTRVNTPRRSRWF